MRLKFAPNLKTRYELNTLRPRKGEALLFWILHKIMVEIICFSDDVHRCNIAISVEHVQVCFKSFLFIFIFIPCRRPPPPRPPRGALCGKKDRDDRQKSYKDTLKISSYENLRTPKGTPWSNINLKIPISRSLFKKKRIQKICTHNNLEFLYPKKYRFYFFK